MLISKFMMSLSGQQTITMDILSKYYMKKSNHNMKFSQLIEYNKRNIFLQKSCRESGRATSSRPLFD